MQHWVLCEVLGICGKQTTAETLTFIDAHSMAPIASCRTETAHAKKRKFDSVNFRLPGQKSTYEVVWNELAPKPGTYPNSANFVCKIWPLQHVREMLLCEIDEDTADDFDSWAQPLRAQGINVEVSCGDWRDRFKCGLPSQGDLVFVSFDPDMINRNPRRVKPRKMYPDDLDLVVRMTGDFSNGTILQLSTYNTNDDNSLDDVKSFTSSKLQAGGFELVADVRVKNHMMSLIYQKNVDLSDELSGLARRFQIWLSRYR